METLKELKKNKTWHNVPLKGRWRLVYKVTNSQGPSAFGGYHLPVYPNPFTGQKTFLKNADEKALNGYLIDKIAKVLKPEENINEEYLVSWLICHPEVNLEGIKDLDPKILETKRASKITLMCLEIDELGKYEEEDYIDKVIGLLTLEGGAKAIGLSRIRYILAYLGQSYREPRYEGSAEKSALRSRLKNFARSSYKNAEDVNRAIANIDEGKNLYHFKEFVRLKTINMVNGIYKFNNAPLGTDFASVNATFNNHPEIKNEILMKSGLD
jgi:hypothetical protein